MRYIVISDVHGEFDKMIKALEDIHFDKEKDTLITNGDLIDRGPKVRQIIEYVLSCPHHICIWGNHEHMLHEILTGHRFYDSYIDTYNGVPATLKSYRQHYWVDAVDAYQLSSEMNSLKRYFRECVNAVEIGKYLISHAGAPFDYKNASNQDWKNYSYRDSIIWYKSIGCRMKKTNVIGHFWASEFYKLFECKNISNDIFKNKNLVCIDGKANASDGKVNTFIINSKKDVIYY